MGRDLEGPIHRSIIAWLQAVLPGAIVHHSPNEVPLVGKAVARAIAKAKWNGMVVGFPDILVLPGDGKAILLEVKASRGNLSPGQTDVHLRLASLGYCVGVVRSIEDARNALASWGVVTREAMQ